ncbi:uncharacterized protein LOC132719730 [Ruditapes philippinarum]|uniref:uncharacterized protein LOC132719730 n=1 Tax=Ruditapes philippinarum TaxID=129788 RepID=UPI00295AC33D|nr:uncharacterized protein LOC132719730 [Ruditapes philippinarum]XP_060559563.1 uncharacterized protein LOC132719730 [Ruditapes philippinarum]
MDEADIDRASKRANIIEQRIYEMRINSMNLLKYSAAIELGKSQTQMKKRLRKYRDKQRQIFRGREGYQNDPIDELIVGQYIQTPRSKPSGRSAVSRAVSSGRTSRRKKHTTKDGGCESDSESDIEADSLFMIDQQRSKIDLRPKTAMEIMRKGTSLESYIHDGRLGSQTRQVKYFDEDELKEREQIYKYLVERRINFEKNIREQLDEKVARFCGNNTVQTMLKKVPSKVKMFSK